jgi:hypothetical protein
LIGCSVLENAGNTSLAFLKNSSPASGASDVSIPSSGKFSISDARFMGIGM